MRVLKAKKFNEFCGDNGVSDIKLSHAIMEIEAGLIDAELGAGIIKKRLAREGEGKSGGYRTIIVYKRGDRAIFLYAFPKNVMENIDGKTLKNLKLLAKSYNILTEAQLLTAIREGKFVEVPYETW